MDGLDSADGGGGGVPNPKQRRMWLCAAVSRMETITHLSTSDKLPVLGGLKMKLAPVWISQDWACRRLQNARYVTLFHVKVRLVVLKSPSVLLVDKVDLINKRKTAHICQCCNRDLRKHNCKLLSACWIMRNNSGLTQFDFESEQFLWAPPHLNHAGTGILQDKAQRLFKKKTTTGFYLICDNAFEVVLISERAPWKR